MSEETQEILARLPDRLRETRKSQGLSLDAVAKMSGVSRSMVSQIERGESSPTIATLWNLTRALNVDFAGLLEAPRPSNITVLKMDAAPQIQGRGTSCHIRILSPPESAGRHEVYELAFLDAGALESAPHSAGTTEHLTVLSGRLHISSGEDNALLETGDAAWYRADVPHVIRAEGPARAHLIVQAKLG